MRVGGKKKIKIAGLNASAKRTANAANAVQKASSKIVAIAARMRAPSAPKPKKKQAPAARQQKRFDPKISSYVNAVINPWSAELTRGLTADRMLPMTAVVRRMNACTMQVPVDLNLPTGAELVVVLNDNRDPYLVVSYKDNAGQTVVRQFGMDANVVDNYSIPGGSYARIISTGVRIRYLGAAVDRGGSFYHFPHDRESTGIDGLVEDNAWGTLSSELMRAISIAPVSDRPTHFFAAPEAGFAPVTAHTNWTAGIPPSEPISCLKLLFLGPAKALNISIEICQMLEYFHLSHRHMASVSMPHPSGLAVQQALASHMQQQGSGHSSPDHGGAAKFVSKIVRVAEEAAHIGVTVGRGYKTVKGALSTVGAAFAAL